MSHTHRNVVETQIGHLLLDAVIMLGKLLVVEAKLIHKVCGHLLDLVV